MVFPWQSDTVGFGAALARTLRDREDATPLPAFVRAGRATGAWFDTGTGNIMAPGDKRGSAAAGPWNRALRFEIAFADVVPGFAKLLANEGANDVWWDYQGGKTPNHFIRQQKRGTRLSWQTAAVPEEYTADRVRFVFVGAMGYRSEPATAGFEMAWEGAAPIAFDLTRQRQSWTNADDTATLVFEPTWQDASDAAGYFFLTVDRKYWTAGQPLSLTVVSKGEGSQRWFAIHPVPHPTRVDTLAGASTD